VYRYVRDIPSRLPKSLEYIWEGSIGPKHGVVSLEDALGRHVEIPAVPCTDYEVWFSPSVRALFTLILYSLSTMFWKSCSGNWQRVLRKYYEIEDAEGNVISTVQWEKKVFLGV